MSSFEVRRCAECREPAVVEVGVQHVQHEMVVAGLPARSSSTRRRFRCQECGARFQLRPRSEAITQIALAAVLLAAVSGMEIAVAVRADSAAMFVITLAVFAPFQLAFISMLALGRSRLRAAANNPIVDGAEPPAMRFFELDKNAAPRRCATCGADAPLESTTRHRVQGIPVGTVWRYRCSACDHEIALRSTWHSMQPELIIVVALAQLVVPMFAADYARWSLLVGLAAVAIVAISVARARAQAHRYPPAIAPARAVRAKPERSG